EERFERRARIGEDKTAREDNRKQQRTRETGRLLAAEDHLAEIEIAEAGSETERRYRQAQRGHALNIDHAHRHQRQADHRTHQRERIESKLAYLEAQNSLLPEWKVAGPDFGQELLGALR